MQHYTMGNSNNSLDAWVNFSNRHFNSFNREFSEFLAEGAEKWMIAYNSILPELKESKQKDRQAIFYANEKLKEYQFELRDLKKANLLVNKNINSSQNTIEDLVIKTAEDEANLRNQIFTNMQEKHPDILDEAIDMWYREYEAQKYISPDEEFNKKYQDNGAMKIATCLLKKFYDGYQKGIKNAPDLESRNSNLKFDLHQFEEYMTPLIKKIEVEHPDKLDEALDLWVNSYSKLQIVRQSPEDYVDPLGVKIADRRLEYFYKKLEQPE